MQRVLFVGHGSDTVHALSRELEALGYRTAICPAAEAEATLVDEEPPDVLVVDLTTASEEPALPRLWREAEGGEPPPAIALLDQGQLPQYEFPLGIDDFLLLPASAGELAARVRQALRRRVLVQSEDVLRCGHLLIDPANYKVFVGDRPVNLTYKEYELLRFLATSADKVFTREALLNKVWGYDYYGGARTVDVHIRRLRSKIEDRHHSFIETIRNVGYRFHVSS